LAPDLVRRVLGEKLEEDLAGYVQQLRRAQALLGLFEDLIATAVAKGIAKAFPES